MTPLDALQLKAAAAPRGAVVTLPALQLSRLLTAVRALDRIAFSADITTLDAAILEAEEALKPLIEEETPS